MPPRILRDVLIVDRSMLARNMYQLLFSPQTRFRIRFSEEYESLFKRSQRLRPDLLLINSNSLPVRPKLKFPCPAILILSKNRFDLKEEANEMKDVVLIEKPFYPYDLISVANRLATPIHEMKQKIRKVRKKRV